jgi:hypothetical protein
MATKQTNMRLPQELLDRIDRVQQQHKLKFRNRTDMTIELINKGLALYDVNQGYNPDDLVAAMQQALATLPKPKSDKDGTAEGI